MSSASSSSMSEGDPEIRLATIDTWLAIGPRPTLITGMIREWLTIHFASRGTIEHVDLKDHLWTAQDCSAIAIESITQYKPNQANKNPAILIRRETTNFTRLGINNEMMGGMNTTADYQEYAMAAVGSHTLFCKSSEPRHAETLAAEVYRELLHFGVKVRECLDLYRFAVASIGSLFEIEEERKHYAVPVVVAYAYEETWQIRPHAPRLKNITISGLEP